MRGTPAFWLLLLLGMIMTSHRIDARQRWKIESSPNSTESLRKTLENRMRNGSLAWVQDELWLGGGEGGEVPPRGGFSDGIFFNQHSTCMVLRNDVQWSMIPECLPVPVAGPSSLQSLSIQLPDSGRLSTVPSPLSVSALLLAPFAGYSPFAPNQPRAQTSGPLNLNKTLLDRHLNPYIGIVTKDAATEPRVDFLPLPPLPLGELLSASWGSPSSSRREESTTTTAWILKESAISTSSSAWDDDARKVSLFVSGGMLIQIDLITGDVLKEIPALLDQILVLEMKSVPSKEEGHSQKGIEACSSSSASLPLEFSLPGGVSGSFLLDSQWTVLNVTSREKVDSPTNHGEHDELALGLCRYSLAPHQTEPSFYSVNTSHATPSPAESPTFNRSQLYDLGLNLFLLGGQSCSLSSARAPLEMKTQPGSSHGWLVAELHFIGYFAWQGNSPTSKPLAQTFSPQFVEARSSIPRFFFVSQKPPKAGPSFPQPAIGEVFEMEAFSRSTSYFTRLSNFLVSAAPYEDGLVYPVDPPLFLLNLEMPMATRTGMCPIWPPHLLLTGDKSIARLNLECSVQITVQGTKPAYTYTTSYPVANLRHYSQVMRGTQLVIVGGEGSDGKVKPQAAGIHLFDAPVLKLFKRAELPSATSEVEAPKFGPLEAIAEGSALVSGQESITFALQYCDDNVWVKLSSNSHCSDNLLSQSLELARQTRNDHRNFLPATESLVDTWVLNSCGSQWNYFNTSVTVLSPTNGAYICFSYGFCAAPTLPTRWDRDGTASGSGSTEGDEWSTDSMGLNEVRTEVSNSIKRCSSGYIGGFDSPFNTPNCMWSACCGSPMALVNAVGPTYFPPKEFSPECFFSTPALNVTQPEVPSSFYTPIRRTGFNWFPAHSSRFQVEVVSSSADSESHDPVPALVVGAISLAIGLGSIWMHQYRQIQIVKQLQQEIEQPILSPEEAKRRGGYSQAKDPVLLLLSEERECKSTGFNGKTFGEFLSKHPIGQTYRPKELIGTGGSGTIFKVVEAAENEEERASKEAKRRVVASSSGILSAVSLKTVSGALKDQSVASEETGATMQRGGRHNQEEDDEEESPPPTAAKSSKQHFQSKRQQRPGGTPSEFPYSALKATMSLGDKEWAEAQGELLTSLMMMKLFGPKKGVVPITGAFWSFERAPGTDETGAVVYDQAGKRRTPWPKFSCLVTPYASNGDLSTWVQRYFDPPQTLSKALPSTPTNPTASSFVSSQSTNRIRGGVNVVPLNLIARIGLQIGELLSAMHTTPSSMNNSDDTSLMGPGRDPKDGQAKQRRYFLVHRDLKPENILVMKYEPAQLPRLSTGFSNESLVSRQQSTTTGGDEMSFAATPSFSLRAGISVKVNDFATTLAYDQNTLFPLKWKRTAGFQHGQLLAQVEGVVSSSNRVNETAAVNSSINDRHDETGDCDAALSSDDSSNILSGLKFDDSSCIDNEDSAPSLSFAVSRTSGSPTTVQVSSSTASPTTTIASPLQTTTRRSQPQRASQASNGPKRTVWDCHSLDDYSLEKADQLPEPAFSLNYVPPEYIQAMRNRKLLTAATSAIKVEESADDARRRLCAADVWGVGGILYAVASRRCSVETSRVLCTDAKQESFSTDVRLELEPHYPNEFVELVLAALHPQPSERISLIELLERLQGFL